MIVIIHLQRGISSNRESSVRNDYVPALCTHRPSLLPTERIYETFGPATGGLHGSPAAGKSVEYVRLEEVKVVTRFP